VDTTTEVILGLRRPLSVRIPEDVQDAFGASSKVSFEADVLVYGQPDVEFENRGEPAHLIVDLPSQTLDALAPTGELGQFALTPSESGDHALYLVLAKPRFGDDEVDFPLQLPVRTVEVAGKPLSAVLLGTVGTITLILGLLTGGLGVYIKFREAIRAGQSSAQGGS
jgi:hypothetical protein